MMMAVVAHKRSGSRIKEEGKCIANLGHYNGHVMDAQTLVNSNLIYPYYPPYGPEVVMRGRQWLRTEQKSLELMRELVCRYSMKGSVVVDLYGGTFSTALACITDNRTVVCFERDVECATLAVRHVYKKAVARNSGLADGERESEVMESSAVELDIEVGEEILKRVVARACGSEDSLVYAEVRSFMLLPQCFYLELISCVLHFRLKLLAWVWQSRSLP
jgi:hypothetical protein